VSRGPSGPHPPWPYLALLAFLFLAASLLFPRLLPIVALVQLTRWPDKHAPSLGPSSVACQRSPVQGNIQGSPYPTTAPLLFTLSLPLAAAAVATHPPLSSTLLCLPYIAVPFSVFPCSSQSSGRRQTCPISRPCPTTRNRRTALPLDQPSLPSSPPARLPKTTPALPTPALPRDRRQPLRRPSPRPPAPRTRPTLAL
jgi:hypothetical protein